MRFYASLLSLSVLFFAGCGKPDAVDHGFVIDDVSINEAYQSLNVRLRQQLQLGPKPSEALEHGVVLFIKLELELHNDNNLMLVRRDTRQFQLRYLPLSERYQLSEDNDEDMQVYPRLRHVLAAIGNVNVNMVTGPLLPGKYKLRTRVSLDESRLPTPMQLPAWFSSDWHHDSEWSVWPFEVSV